MNNLSLYLILQCIIIVLVLAFICYIIKGFLIPIIKNKTKEGTKEEDTIKAPKTIIETDTEVIYYYENGDEYHSPINN